MRRSVAITLVYLMCWVVPASHVSAQFHDPDPNAVEAFEELVETYRERPAFTVETIVNIELEQDGLRAQSGEVSAAFTIGKRRKGVLNIRGFTVYVADGEIAAIHEDNDEAYFRSSDGGSAYYSLANAFVDLPFPHIAIAFGEEDPLDLCMQFHPRAPWSRPTSVEQITDEDGEPLTRILLTSDHEEMQLLVDPESQFIQSLKLTITGGHYAREGVNIIYQHEFEYEVHEEDDIEGLFAFDPGERRRVDTMAALRPRRADAGVGDRRGVGGGLTGGEAPPITLPTLHGEVFDLEGHRGNVVVLDFWATWCRPCLRILPTLHEIAEWADDEGLPVTIATVNVWEIPDADSTPEQRREQAAAFWDQHKFTLTVVLDAHDEAATAYRLQGIPATIVIRPDGVVHLEHVGTDNYDKAIRNAILEALEEVDQ